MFCGLYSGEVNIPERVILTRLRYLAKRKIRNSMLQNNNKQSSEAKLDVSFQTEAFLCQSDLLQFFSWLNCWEKKGHGSFNERFVLL